jgi:hypothetical protein
VTVEMRDLDVVSRLKTLSVDDIRKVTTYFPPIPFVASSSSVLLGTLSIKGETAKNLHFSFFSMNATWSETLNLRKVNEEWVEAIKITKENTRTGKELIVFTEVPPNYPKVNGKVDW